MIPTFPAKTRPRVLEARLLKPEQRLSAIHVLVSLALLSLLCFLAKSTDLFVPLLVAAAVVLTYGLFFVPEVFLFLAPIPFLLAAMPGLDPGNVFQTVRWVFLALLGISLFVRSGTGWLSRMGRPVYWSLALFVVICLASIQYSSNAAMTLFKSLAFGFLLLAAVVQGVLADREGIAQVCSAFAWLAVLVVLSCGLIVARQGLEGPGGNFAGLFMDANSLGVFVGLVIPFLWFLMVRSVAPGLITRVVAGIISLAAVTFLLASHSRAGIGAAVLACGWWLFFSSRRAVALVVAGAAAAAFMAAIYLPANFSSVEQEYILKGRDSVLESRVALWRKSLEAIEESPFLGAGFGASRGASQGWQLSTQTGKWAREKGNSYLAVAGEVGLFGTLLLLFPVAWVLFRVAHWLSECRRKRDMGPEFWAALALSSCLIGGVTDAFAEAWLTAAGFFATVIFWIAFGALAARMTRRPSLGSR